MKQGSVIFVHTRGGRLLPYVGSVFEKNHQHPSEGHRPSVCFVPDTAPVIEDRSVLENTVLLARLAGARVSRDEAVHALRLVEVPDALHQRLGRRLEPLQRLLIWLAVARLVGPGALAFESPFSALTADATASFSRLLVEASQVLDTVIVSGPDPSVAGLLSPTVVMEIDGALQG